MSVAGPAAGAAAGGAESAGAVTPDAASPETVRFFQALGDGTRLELLELLRDRERTVGELVESLGCPQPKVSRHLKVLKEAGLVHDRREGRNVTYALATRKGWPEPARAWLERLDAGMLPEEMMPAKPGGGTSSAQAVPAGRKPATPRPEARRARPPRDLEPWLL
jgi:DNA-binding transcriptional ArsR family regulator